MRLHPSTKILFGAIAFGCLAYGGSTAYTKLMLRNVSLDPVPAGDVCLMAIDKDAGVKVITANQMVQVVEASSNFGAEKDPSGAGPTSGAVRRRIPVRELVGVLDGDPDCVPVFIKKMRPNDDESEANPDATTWTKADIEKAIGGDPQLKAKLESDLSMTIDGVPLQNLNQSTFFNGIRIRIPVTLNIPNAKGKSLEGEDIVNFRPRFVAQFYKHMREKFYDKAQLQNYYRSFLKDESPKDPPLGDTMASVFKRSQNSEERDKVTQIANHSKILASRSMISNASMKEDATGKDKTYDLTIHLTPEGKNRLWKFSSEGGTQIMLVSKGVAIAAATIGTQLNSEELVIRQITNESLVREVVELLQSKG